MDRKDDILDALRELRELDAKRLRERIGSPERYELNRRVLAVIRRIRSLGFEARGNDPRRAEGPF